ncbi:MAG: hypothetical protein QFE16_06665 [Pseudomonadota bacterium]|nr:hypothetical protein [Pseudomonadota bacterium]
MIEAAPGLAKSARGFFKRTQDAVDATADDATVPSAAASEADALAMATRRIASLEARLTQATELLDSLASQNARMVEAIDALRQRGRALVIAGVVLAAALIGTLIWVASIAR